MRSSTLLVVGLGNPEIADRSCANFRIGHDAPRKGHQFLADAQDAIDMFNERLGQVGPYKKVHGSDTVSPFGN